MFAEEENHFHVTSSTCQHWLVKRSSRSPFCRLPFRHCKILQKTQLLFHCAVCKDLECDFHRTWSKHCTNAGLNATIFHIGHTQFFEKLFGLVFCLLFLYSSQAKVPGSFDICCRSQLDFRTLTDQLWIGGDVALHKYGQKLTIITKLNYLKHDLKLDTGCNKCKKWCVWPTSSSRTLQHYC